MPWSVVAMGPGTDVYNAIHKEKARTVVLPLGIPVQNSTRTSISSARNRGRQVYRSAEFFLASGYIQSMQTLCEDGVAHSCLGCDIGCFGDDIDRICGCIDDGSAANTKFRN